MKINFIDLKTQYTNYKNEIDSEIAKVLESSQYIGGAKLETFETNLKNYVGSSHAIGCSSGTDALLLALMAIDLQPGDEVITTPFTFIATAEVIALLGAKPVFVDIEKESYNIDAAKIKAAITTKTKAIIPVSLYGQVADMDQINAIAAEHNLIVIEDGCQSFGATYKGKKSCNLSYIGCTSFFPSKPLGAYGDGGAIFCNDDALAQKIRFLLNHGQNKRYNHKYIGINGRLDTIQAAILDVKLKHFEDELKKRDEIARRYIDSLKDIKGISVPIVKEDRRSVFAQFTLVCEDRDKIQTKLNNAGIPTAIHYPKPLHLQEVFKYLNYKEGDFPISEQIAKKVLSIPMSAYLSSKEQEFIINSIKGIQ